jgi:hypothetical protein
MASDDRILKRGIWQRGNTIAPELDSSKSMGKFFSDNQWDQTPENFVRTRIAQAIAAAKEVLERSGHPTEEGVYGCAKGENLRWIGLPGSDAVKSLPSTKRLSAWPNFLEVEPLSIEEFAVRVIRNANRLLQAMSSASNNWEIAATGLYFEDAMFHFRVEQSGIAKKAEQGLKVSAGGQSGNTSKANNSQDRQAVVLILALEHVALPQNAKKSSIRAIADSILPKLKASGAVLPNVKSDLIRKDIAVLVKNGKISLGRTARFTH